MIRNVKNEFFQSINIYFAEHFVCIIYIIHHYLIIVAHSGSLLGLSEQKSKAAVLKESQLLLLRAGKSEE